MNEMSSFKTEPAEQPKQPIQLVGPMFGELIRQKSIEIKSGVVDLLKLLLDQNRHLSHIGIVFIPPEEEPNTAGFFETVEISSRQFYPEVFIVSESQEHAQKLKNTRESSAKKVAEMLGIDFSKLTPELFKKFIIAHEFGHASDYIKNYESNPVYQTTKAAEEWKLHTESVLSLLPFPGVAPSDLYEEILKFNTLTEFVKAHPETEKTININEIKTLQDLLHAQELAYRSSPYESYADKFAADFLLKNALALGITELVVDKDTPEVPVE